MLESINHLFLSLPEWELKTYIIGGATSLLVVVVALYVWRKWVILCLKIVAGIGALLTIGGFLGGFFWAGKHLANQESIVIVLPTPSPPTITPYSREIQKVGVYLCQIRVSKDMAYVYIGPGENYLLLTAVNKDMILNVITTNTDQSWFAIQWPNGRYGWIDSASVEMLEEGNRLLPQNASAMQSDTP